MRHLIKSYNNLKSLKYYKYTRRIRRSFRGRSCWLPEAKHEKWNPDGRKRIEESAIFPRLDG